MRLKRPLDTTAMELDIVPLAADGLRHANSGGINCGLGIFANHLHLVSQQAPF